MLNLPEAGVVNPGKFDQVVNGPVSLSELDFGQPEAEHDGPAIEKSFYEAASWKAIAAGRGMPFVVGRKGSGKSAVAARLELVTQKQGNCCFIRIVPANFRHVEVRELLGCLVNKSTSWQYIYRKVWEGIILGQIVRHTLDCTGRHANRRLSSSLRPEIEKFQATCGFYVAPLGDALSDVISNYVKEASKKTDALSQVELRKRLEPYPWGSLIQSLQEEFHEPKATSPGMFIAIDGLDEHWDKSPPSLYFLAELLAVAKNFTAAFGFSIRFVVCLRDNIFRALVDTKCIEYDKLESLITNLEWNSRSLFELVARRVAPSKKIESAVSELRNLLPESVGGLAVEEYLARHVLQRPRDYVNFFRMLQKESQPEPRAGEGHIQDAVGKYCANRLVDLENEFGLTYPRISHVIANLHSLPDLFRKEDLLTELARLMSTPSFKANAPELMHTYGQPSVLARILVSIGVVGTYDPSIHAVRFVHEFSESRVSGLWESATSLGIHPVYSHKKQHLHPIRTHQSSPSEAPAILTHPPDYLAEKDAIGVDLESHSEIQQRKRNDLLAALTAIEKGQSHFRRFETWVRDTLSTCFIGDLLNGEEQVATQDGKKRFDMIFDITGTEAPWHEIKDRLRTHRLLVECKNTDEPTDADFNKLLRDMKALDFHVAFLAYRGASREPQGKLLNYQRSAFQNSKKEDVIITLSEVFLTQCLRKKGTAKCRNNLNTLWRDHLQRWLPV